MAKCDGCRRKLPRQEVKIPGENLPYRLCQSCIVAWHARRVLDAAGRAGVTVPAWLEQMRSPVGYEALLPPEGVSV